MLPDRAFFDRLADAARKETLPRFRVGADVVNKEAAGFDPVTEGDRAAPPSEGKQLEVGWKQEWLGQRLLTTVSAFDLELTNAPANDPAHTGYSVLTARQRIRGVELELQGRITPGWTVTAQASFHDPKVQADTTAGANVGHRIALATRRTASLWTQYRLPQRPGAAVVIVLHHDGVGAAVRLRGGGASGERRGGREADAEKGTKEKARCHVRVRCREGRRHSRQAARACELHDGGGRH